MPPAHVTLARSSSRRERRSGRLWAIAGSTMSESRLWPGRSPQHRRRGTVTILADVNSSATVTLRDRADHAAMSIAAVPRKHGCEYRP